MVRDPHGSLRCSGQLLVSGLQSGWALQDTSTEPLCCQQAARMSIAICGKMDKSVIFLKAVQNTLFLSYNCFFSYINISPFPALHSVIHIISHFYPFFIPCHFFLFQQVRGNFARLHSCVEELRSIPSEGCIRGAAAGADLLRQAVLDSLQQFKQYIRHTSAGSQAGSNISVEVRSDTLSFHSKK